MPRVIHADVIAALALDHVQRAILVKTAFVAATEFWTDYGHDLVFDGDTYNAASSFISITGINDNSGVSVGGFTIKAQNIDRSILGVLMNQDVSGRRVDVWEAVIDDDGVIVGDPIELKIDASISTYSSQTGERSANITMNCASAWANFQTQAGRYSTLASQQRYFPLDTGMKNASETTNTKAWGASN